MTDDACAELVGQLLRMEKAAAPWSFWLLVEGEDGQPLLLIEKSRYVVEATGREARKTARSKTFATGVVTADASGAPELTCAGKVDPGRIQRVIRQELGSDPRLQKIAARLRVARVVLAAPTPPGARAAPAQRSERSTPAEGPLAELRDVLGAHHPEVARLRRGLEKADALAADDPDAAAAERERAVARSKARLQRELVDEVAAMIRDVGPAWSAAKARLGADFAPLADLGARYREALDANDLVAARERLTALSDALAEVPPEQDEAQLQALLATAERAWAAEGEPEARGAQLRDAADALRRGARSDAARLLGGAPPTVSALVLPTPLEDRRDPAARILEALGSWVTA